MKICIIGGSGVIGSKLVQGLIKDGHEIYFTFFQNKMSYPENGIKLDITDVESTKKFLSDLNPDIVIHTTALSNVDLCETNKILANKINIEGTKNIVEGCKITNSKLVYVSTSFVFDGKKQEYFEDDKPCPATYYGYTKLKGEELVKNSDVSYLILRIDQPYCWIESWQHTNSVLRVLKTLRSGKKLEEVVDWYNTPTYVPDFVNATSILLSKNLEGIFHIVGSNYLNRYDWALITAKKFHLNVDLIKSINSIKLELTVKRVNVNLKNQKLFKKTGIKMKGVKEGGIEMFREECN
jgi:dTDP-4-dehydrorhamnose reductase